MHREWSLCTCDESQIVHTHLGDIGDALDKSIATVSDLHEMYNGAHAGVDEESHVRGDASVGNSPSGAHKEG